MMVSAMEEQVYPIDEVKTFSDFVQKPAEFDDFGSLLFKKMCSNASFKIEDEVIYVITGIIVERSAYFKEMLELISLESHIPVYGIDAVLFKITIEWIYTCEIRCLNGPSITLLADLERVYIAARMYKINDLCISIESYLKYLVNEWNFGEINTSKTNFFLGKEERGFKRVRKARKS
jgi:hypothetical protein